MPQSSPAPSRSVPESIAATLASEIAAEHLKPGERLTEIKLATRFEASRGSVRDALRLLEQRNLIEMQPNRGAVVIGIPLEVIADNFAVTSTLIGLASRYVIQQARPDIVHAIEQRYLEIIQRVGSGFTPPIQFASALGRFFALMITGSGNRTVRGMISTILTEASWEAMWETPCDHLTLERQREVAGMIQSIWERIVARDCEGAEREIRLFHESHRDAVLHQISIRRKQSVDKSHLISFADLPAPKDIRPNLETRLERLERTVSRLAEQSGQQHS